MNAEQFDTIAGRPAGFPVPPGDAPARRSRPSRCESAVWTLPGICDGMRVTTSFGDLPVQALRRRDPLRLQAGTLATVEWVDCINLDEEFLAGNPDAQPVRIPAGTFGNGRPGRDLLVSPHQYVNASPTQFAQDFRLARDLTGRPGVVRQPVPVASYYLFHCGAPAAVMVEGLCMRISP